MILPCPVPGCFKHFKNAAGLGGHLRAHSRKGEVDLIVKKRFGEIQWSKLATKKVNVINK